MKMRKATPFMVVGLLGLACSSSGLKTIADGGVARRGQAGSTSSTETGSATGGTIGSGGVGVASTGGTARRIGSGGISVADAGVHGGAGASDAGGSNRDGATAGSSGTGDTGGQGPICAAYLMCNSGDQQVGMDCPAERECYTLSLSCGSGQYNTTTCVLPVGVHCDDPLLCNPGDTPMTLDDLYGGSCDGYPSPCYQINLCAQVLQCRYGTDAGVDASAWDAGLDEAAVPRCGDGILEPGEQCDMGGLNGLVLDASGNPTDAGGCPSCSTDCTILLCVF